MLGYEVIVLDVQERRYGALPSGVHFISGNLSMSYLLREALLGVDVVFHLAWATIHEVSNRDPAGDVTTNLLPTLELLETCKLSDVQKVVFASSGGTVYGPAQSLPIPEDHPLCPVNSYGITKLAVEKYLEMYRHLYGLEYAALRPSVPYGPRQNPLARQGAVPVFLYRVARGLPIDIWGDGSVTRDFFYVTDLVEAFIKVAFRKQPTEHRVFNVGGGREISLLQLVRLVEETVGRKAEVDFQAARPFDAPRVLLDTRLAEDELDWRPTVSLQEGLARTWHWMSQELSM